MIGFCPSSLTSLTYAVLMHPVDSFRGFVEVVRDKPGIFSDAAFSLKDIVRARYFQAVDYFRRPEDVLSRRP